MEYQELSNSAVKIRLLTIADFEEIKPLSQDKEVFKNFTSDLSTDENLYNWIKTQVENYEKGTTIPFVVIDQETKAIVGCTTFLNISERDKRIEIGSTWYPTHHQKKGFNRNAKLLLLEFAFEKWNANRVEFKTATTNKGSRKALLGIGACEEGVLRSHTLMPGNWYRDTIFYSILKAEWKMVKTDLLKKINAF